MPAQSSTPCSEPFGGAAPGAAPPNRSLARYLALVQAGCCGLDADHAVTDLHQVRCLSGQVIVGGSRVLPAVVLQVRPVRFQRARQADREIGRASCRERGCNSEVARTITSKTTTKQMMKTCHE